MDNSSITDMCTALMINDDLYEYQIYIANVRKLSDILQDGFSGKRIVESISGQVKYISVYNLI